MVRAVALQRPSEFEGGGQDERPRLLPAPTGEANVRWHS